MQSQDRELQEYNLVDEDDHDVFNLGRYDEEEDLFNKLKRKRRLETSKMLKFNRWCAAVVSLFRFPKNGAPRSLSFIICRNVMVILVYYVLSIGLTFYQNHLLKQIHFPLSVVLCHLVVKFLLATFIRISYEIWTGKKRVLLDCQNWFKKLSLIGISGGLDIGFSNWAQEFVTVSLYTMSKSTAIIFILGFALLLKLEERHWNLIIIVGMISLGLLLFTYKSTQFHLLGFLLIMAASFLSGLRWTMCQVIVQKSEIGLHNPIDMVYHVQPWMMIAVLPFALFFEGSLITSEKLSWQTAEEKAEFLKVLSAVLVGAFMAFFMEVAEYLVVTYTSSLTLSVASIFKELVTLLLAVIFNGDQLTFINFIGLVMCFTGIICHVAFKFTKSTRECEPSVATTSTSGAHLGQRNAGGTGVGGGNATKDLLVKDEESETPLLLNSEYDKNDLDQNTGDEENDL